MFAVKRWRDLGAGVRRFPGGERVADLLLWVVICAPGWLESEPAWLGRPIGLPPVWGTAAGMLLLGLAVAVSRRHPVVAAAAPAALALAVTPELYTDAYWIPQVLLAFLLGRRTSGMRTGLLFCGGVCLAGLGLVALLPDVTRVTWTLRVQTALATIMLPWLAGRYVRQHDELVRTGWELAERLERERDLVGERTRLLERSRIAGDMHDSLGHELSLIALRAAALQVNPALDEPAREAAAELRASAFTATGRLREIIGVLREDGASAPVLPSGDTVTALVERAAASGMAVTLQGDLGPLPPMADRAAYRVVQESLTNATKHAPGAAVTVRLSVDEAAGEAVVAVANLRPPADTRQPSAAPHHPSASSPDVPPTTNPGGYGLVGLDERVRLAGGRLDARHVDGGFEVIARLPLAERAAMAPVTAAPTSSTSPTSPTSPTPSALPTAPLAHRELARARRNVRRSVIDAIWLPVVVIAALLLLTHGLELHISRRSVLDATVYADLRLGQSLASTAGRLPPYRMDDDRNPEGAPKDPAGVSRCRFYRVTAETRSPAYRLCFTDGRLTHKDKVPLERR